MSSTSDLDPLLARAASASPLHRVELRPQTRLYRIDSVGGDVEGVGTAVVRLADDLRARVRRGQPRDFDARWPPALFRSVANRLEFGDSASDSPSSCPA